MKLLILKGLTVVGVGLVAFAAKLQLVDPVFFIQIVGAVISLLGIFYWVMELRSNLPYFYGHSQSAGSNANASVVVGIGLALVANSWFNLVGYLILALLILVLLQRVVKRKKIA